MFFGKPLVAIDVAKLKMFEVIKHPTLYRKHRSQSVANRSCCISFVEQMLVKGSKEMEIAGHKNRILGMVVCIL
jgi:hypothetical protein